MSERMEKSLLTKSQRELEINTAVLKATVQEVERLF